MSRERPNVQPVPEFEHEPLPGLPEELPEGESILWQGAPEWRGLALRSFHVRKLAVYFAALLVWQLVAARSHGLSFAAAADAAFWPTLLSLLVIALLTGLAWLYARTTVYTVTERRVVMRFGVAMVMAVNLPFRSIRSAALRRHRDGSGDLPLDVSGECRLGYLMLWPNVRPWHLGRGAQPMLRAVPDAERVAAILAGALAAADAGRAELHDTSLQRASSALAVPAPLPAAGAGS